MIVNIQALRALAATLVMFVHMATFAILLGGGERTLAFGNCGIDLFFVISGFIMMHGAMAKRSAAGAFLLNRIIRVVPLYWLTTLALFALALVEPSLLGDTRADIGQLLLSLVFVAFDRGGGAVQPLFFLGWTLNYEMFFYACFAASLAATRSRPLPTMLCCAGLLLACIAIGATIPGKGPVATFYTSDIMLEFLLGMATAWVLAARAAPPRWIAVTMTLIGLALLVAIGGRPMPMPHWVALGLPATLAVLGAVWAEQGGLRLSARPVQALGAASYALYLSHPFVMQVFGKVAQKLDSRAATIILAAVGMLTAFAVALLVHRLLELPITDTLRRAVGHRRPVVERADPLAQKERDNRTAVR